ncbi:helix-turn-helix transcriptional regulator [Chryseobacterium sp. FH1]|uniref:helix-turn-helix transcriptional regulator n=1 Tax=Chryseobacterium sp. FH1 TaxID=1233951 RepID=UPI0004E2C5AC|nr:helix-turn-helix transcriptional regulator [Chryseobacterium sp. FH1]KFC19557.1 AraC family transcriptional regulator [Chryseobacterium sp. FH1]
MNYHIFEPTHDLTMFVKCYWTLESSADDSKEKQSIVPDGCMEMIFHYGDLYLQHTLNGNHITQPKCFVIGQLTRPLEIEPTGRTGIFAVRFHPNGFLPFASIPIREMENTAISLEKLFGKDGLDIQNIILNSHSTQEKINLIEKFLLNRLTSTKTIDHIVKSSVETIITANGQLSIEEISRITRVNRRQLERKFSLAIGLSPKQLSKTIRLQIALKLLLTGEFTNLTSLAYENEYYDQAHFIKDFREFVGVTPKEFYGKSLKMTSLFVGD